MRKKVEDYVSGRIAPPPIANALGITLIRAGGGTAEFQYIADGRHANPMGTLHGGILCDLADAAMGIALASTLEDGESFATLELNIHFLRPVWDARLTAKGRIVSRGRTVAMTACDVVDEDQRHIAAVTATQMVLTGSMAKGR
jgi:uncharacterized protein (TIGR00369 family)